MSVILNPILGQCRLLCRACLTVSALLASFLPLCLPAETHWDFQAVDASGVSAWTPSYPVTLTGILLTEPDEMLDPAADFLPWNGGANMFEMGGEWQVAIEAAAPGDRLGIFCYMGQDYGNMPWLGDSDLSYSNQAWTNELNRLEHDPATGHAFHRGDLVQVVANAATFYGGKMNVSEAHDISPASDFTISLVSSNYGLPYPESLSLGSLVRTNDNNEGTHEDIFDVTRATGGEHWQGMRVRLIGLTLVTTNGWNPSAGWDDRTCTVTDGENHYFTLRCPRYSLGSIPTDRFDAVGILNQESGSGTDGTFGYELFVQEIVACEPPILSISSGPVISWPGSLGNYKLQTAESLNSLQWVDVADTAVLANGRWTVSPSASGSQRFYRLQRVQ